MKLFIGILSILVSYVCIFWWLPFYSSSSKREFWQTIKELHVVIILTAIVVIGVSWGFS